MTEKIHEVAKLYLIKLKNKHSKSDGLSADGKVQDYLTSSKLTTEEKQLLFHLRTRTFECKANFSNLYNAELASSICLEEDNQGHLLRCGRTTNGVDLKGVQYSDIFGPIEKQVPATKILMKVTKKRKILQRTSSNLGSQVPY